MIEQAKGLLKKVFGYDSFRSLQEPVLKNILSKNDTLVIMPTGGGKSLCYQLPALIFPGLTVVISPLISLMKDQVEQLLDLGIPAAILNSSLRYDQYRANMGRVYRNEVKLLYLAPETLMKPQILELLDGLSVPVDCLTIDEAHCISEWGHDFRPEYRQLADVRKRFPNAVCVALTATATQRVREDIEKTLNFSASNSFVASFDRENLFLKIISKSNPSRQVLSFLSKYKDQPGIIYCFSRKQVDQLAAFLMAHGFSAAPYHAGLSEEERRRNQELFIRDDIQIIVATIAFGMGINKSNIRFVVHYDLPKNIESYYQEIGRAGRDGLRADCLLLFGYGDIQKIKYFLDQKDENEKRIAQLHLNALLRFAETDVCRRIPLLEYFGEIYKATECKMCDNCTLDEKDLADITIPAQKFLSSVRKTGQMFGAGHIIDILRGSKGQKILKFEHDQLSTYNIGADISKKQWFHLSRQFIQKGVLAQDMEYGSLKITPKGFMVLKGSEKVFGIFEEEEEPKKAAPRKASKVKDGDLDYDRQLFESLREKRKIISSQFRLPPYMIFSDRTLAEMAAYFPQSREGMLTIHGVGQAKMEKYGDLFLDAVVSYCTDNNIAENLRVEISSFPDAPLPEMEPKKARYVEMGEAFNRGLTIDELIQQYSIKLETVINNLLKYLQAGNPLKPDGILAQSTIDAALQAEAMELFSNMGTDFLAPVFNALNGRVSYPQLRILKLYFLSCNS